MKPRIFFFTLPVVFSIAQSSSQIITFDTQEVGKPPKGFSTSLTGKGKPGNWVVQNDTTAPSKPNVLAQTDLDQTDYRFPLCIFDSIIATDVDVTVHFKLVKGSVDQAGGIVWRYQDNNNYYVLRANALENNFRIYHVVAGKRREFAGAKVKVSSNQWHTIQVHNVENKFEAYFDDKKLIEATDTTFKRAGKIGLWTKADSYTLFDDLTIHVLRK